jgi:hypothetical protein
MLSNADLLEPVAPPSARALHRGKKVLAKRLVARINAVPHRLYASRSWAWAGFSSAATSAQAR